MAGGAKALPALAHCEDARSVVAGAVEQAVEPALEGQGDALPLAQCEDAGGVVAHAVQEVVDTAGAGLLPAAVGQTLPGSSQGAEEEQEQEAGSSPGLPEQRAALVQGGGTAERGGLHSPRVTPLPCSLVFQLPAALVVAQPHTRECAWSVTFHCPGARLAPSPVFQQAARCGCPYHTPALLQPTAAVANSLLLLSSARDKQ